MGKITEYTLTNWYRAFFQVYDKEVGGRKGWRLPTVEELASLVDTSIPGSPKLPSGHPFEKVQDVYWSSTTDVNSASNAWGVSFNVGGAGNGGKASIATYGVYEADTAMMLHEFGF